MKNVRLDKPSKGVILVLLLWPVTGAAYIGPGTGLSGLGSLLALLSLTFCAIAGFVWFPIKRLLKLMKKEK